MDKLDKIAYTLMADGLEGLTKKMTQEPRDYNFIRAIANFYYIYITAENTNELDKFDEKFKNFGVDVINSGNVKIQNGGKILH